MPAYPAEQRQSRYYERISDPGGDSTDRPSIAAVHLEETTGTLQIVGIERQNTLRIAAHLDRPGFVIVNQNYYRHGVSTKERDVALEQDDLLAVRLPAGDYDPRLSPAPQKLSRGSNVLHVRHACID